MARIFKLTVELHPPNGIREYYCLEAYEKVGLASERRILHFSLGNPVTNDDVKWATDTLAAQVEQLIGRTTGFQEKLNF